MNLELSRVIVFASDLKTRAAFHRDVLGLPLKPAPDDPRTWLEFHAGACSIALHNSRSSHAERSRRCLRADHHHRAVRVLQWR